MIWIENENKESNDEQCRHIRLRSVEREKKESLYTQLPRTNKDNVEKIFQMIILFYSSWASDFV